MMKTTTTSGILPKGSALSDAVTGLRPIRWLRPLLLFVLALALPKMADATLVTIVGPVPGSSCPTCTYDYWGYSGIGGRSAHTLAADIYGKDEIGTVGKITSLALQKTSGTTSAVMDSVYIFMQETPETKIVSPITMAGYKEVFRGTFPNTTSSGWITATLTTPFDYTGTGNLNILIVRRGSSTYAAQYFQNHYVYGTVYQTGYYTSSSSTWSSWLSASSSSTLYTNGYRLNVQLNLDPFAACTGTPTAGTAVASTTTGCPGVPVVFSLTGSSLASSINYEWDTSATGTGGWALAGTTTTVPGKWSFTPPSGRTLYYRCRSTCSAGGTSVTSTTVSVSISSVLKPPYTEDFETITEGVNVACASSTSWGNYSYWYTKSSSYGPYMINHTPGGSKFLWGGSSLEVGTGITEYWFTPGFELKSGKTYRFSYWYAGDDYPYNNPGTGAYIGTSQTSAAMSPIGPFIYSSVSPYAQYVTDFTVPADKVYFIGIRSRSSYNYGYAFDDLNLIELPLCNTATAADFAKAGKASVNPNAICSLPGTVALSISKTPAFSGLEFKWEVATGSPASFSAAGVTAASGSYTISTGGTYYFRCKVICTATGTFGYSDTVKVFTTPITPPYTEDFEGGIIGQNLPCAANTYYWGRDYYWNLYGSPHAYAKGIRNHTPGGAKYLHAGYQIGYSSGSDEYWFTPALSLTANKAYDVSFWFSNSGYNTYYASYGTTFGITAGTAQTKAAMTINAGSDTTVFLNASTTPSYNQFKRGFIAPTTGVYYVGIKVNHSYYCYYGMAIDDIGINQLPPCSAKPSAGITVATPSMICSTGTTTLSLKGLAAASDLTFQWYESNAAGALVTAIPGATGITYTTGTITAGPVYYRCVVTCGAIGAPNQDVSSLVKINVGPITPPYVEDFESATPGVNQPCAGYTTGWDASTGSGTFTYWGIKGAPNASYPGTSNHTTGGAKYLSVGNYLSSRGGAGSSSAQQYWFSPPLQLTADMAYKCSYWYSQGYTYYTSNNFGLYYGTSQTAAAMTAMRADITGETNTTYKQIVGSFVAPSNGVYYLGVKADIEYAYYGVAIDDIGVEQLPLCTAKPAPGTISADPVMVCSTGSSKLSLLGTSMASKLKFQWQDSSAASGSWNNVSTGTGGATSVYTTGTLTAHTWYRCIVSCPLIPTPNAETTAVYKMNVGPLEPPYKEDFEKTKGGVNVACASYTNSWGPMSAYNYWTIRNLPYVGGYGLTLDNHTPGGSNFLHAGVSLTADEYWFSPGINLKKDSTYQMSYWYLGTGYPYGGATTMGMYYGTAQTKAAMNAITTDLTGVNVSSYKQYVGRFTAPTSNVYYLGVKVRHTYTYSYYGMAVDDIGLEQLPRCTGVPTAGPVDVKPSMMCSAGSTVALNMDLAYVSKVAGLKYKWFYYDAATATIPIDSSAELSSPGYTSTGLPATRWFVCKVTCSNTGDYSYSTRLKVDVGVITPPYIETFETGTAGVNMPCASSSGGWGSSGYNWYLLASAYSTSYPTADNHTPGGSKYLLAGYGLGYTYATPAGGYWFTPAIKFTGGKLYQFSMWYNGTGYSSGGSDITAFYGSTQTEAGMTTTIGIPLVGVNTRIYKYYAQQFTPATTGNYYIGIKVKNPAIGASPGISIDDIGLQEVPPCSAPVVAGTISSDPGHVCSAGDGAVLSLMGSTLATGLNYKWLSSADSAGPYKLTSGTVMPYTTDPLTSNTWFRAIITCAATGATDTSLPYLIGVGGAELPYAEDFESTPVGQKPSCSDATAWGRYYYDAWNVYSGLITGSYTNHTPGGKKYLIGGYYLGGWTTPTYLAVTDDNYWFTPGLNMRGGYKYTLSFWYVGSSGGSNSSRMGVYYGTSQSVGGMTKAIMPFRKVTNTSYVKADTAFTVGTSGTYYIGFKKSADAAGTYTAYYGVAFDDINLNYAPCDGMPQAGGIKSALTSGTSLCKGTPVVLIDTNATVRLVPGIKYQWQRKGIGSGAPSNWQPVVGATDTMLKGDTLVGYQYRMAVVCANTGDSAFTAAFQVPQTPPHPTVTISPSSSPVVYCLGDTVAFTATSFTGAVYDWMRDSATIPGWKFSDLGATEPGTYMVKVSSALSPCPAYSNKVKLQANDPGYKVTITVPSDSILCDGEAITLTAVSSKPGVSFQWRRNNVPIPGAVSTTYTVRTDGSYRVVAFDGISSCPAVSRNIHFSVKPNPPAAVSVPGGTLTACAETGVRLDANVGGFSYQWNRSGSPVFGWVDSSVLVTNSGVYNVKVRSADGCVSVSHDITVSILPSPVPVVKRTDLTLETVLSYSFYQWIRNSADIYMANSRSYLMSKHGLYQVRVTDFNGCLGLSTPIAVFDDDVRLDVDNVSGNSNEIKVYPNPTSAKVNIECPVGFKLTIKDISGKTILERTDAKEVDLSRYADGVYLFMISDKEGTNILKQQRVNKVSAK